MPGDDIEIESLRLDKWLWAARLFKTRGLAAQAVRGGKVQVEGQHSKPGRHIAPGTLLYIRRGTFEIEIRVNSITPRRGPAPQAALLYEETPRSIEARAARAERNRARAGAEARPRGIGRPTKRDRRELARLKGH